tara:strand:+ start:31804 stop:32670 length:867 start_codon:yes stop_codon:yes gene_type:complete
MAQKSVTIQSAKILGGATIIAAIIGCFSYFFSPTSSRNDFSGFEGKLEKSTFIIDNQGEILVLTESEETRTDDKNNMESFRFSPNLIHLDNLEGKPRSKTLALFEDEKGNRVGREVTIVPPEPHIAPNRFDYEFSFGITNLMPSTIEIKKIYIKLSSYTKLDPIIYYIPYKGIREPIGYLVTLDPLSDELDAIRIENANENSWVDIKSSDKEKFILSVNATEEGLYSGEIFVTVDVLGKEHNFSVGSFEDLCFLNQKNIYGLKRARQDEAGQAERESILREYFQHLAD